MNAEIFGGELSELVWAALAGEGAGALVEGIALLHTENRALWSLEARVRDRGLADPQVVELKRAIDAHNLARHAAVRAIDLEVDARTPRQRAVDDPRAIVNSESVGQMADRASILLLKLEHFEEGARRADLVHRRARLSRCLAQVGAALVRGWGTAQAFDEAKTYSA